MSRDLFGDAPVTIANWAASELVLDVDPLLPKQWFYNLSHIGEAKWFARNVANCAWSFKERMAASDTLRHLDQGVPRCARRLKRLLIYFLWVLEQYLVTLWPDLVTQNPDVAKQSDILASFEEAKSFVINLRATLKTLDLRLAPATYELGMYDGLNNTQIPAETMLELLGSFYIWTELKNDGASENLKTPTNVRTLLRSMMTTMVTLTNTNAQAMCGETKDQWQGTKAVKFQKHGISECIFATRATNDVSTLLVGATACSYPDWNRDGGVKGYFKTKHSERFSAAARAELLDRFRQTDYEYMKPFDGLDVKILPDLGFPAPNDGTSRAIVNFYTSQRKRTRATWQLINHQDQTAVSLFVTPSDRKKLKISDDDPTYLQFMQPVPRCLKCRMNQSYIIPLIEAPKIMDKNLSLNAPMNCAEDIVHAKLRILLPKNDEDLPAIAPANDASEISMEAKDSAVIAAGEGDASTAVRTDLVTGTAPEVRSAAPKTVVSTGSNKPAPSKAVAAKVSQEAARRKQPAKKGEKKEEEKAPAPAPDVTSKRAALIRVHTYLQSIKTEDPSGEDVKRKAMGSD